MLIQTPMSFGVYCRQHQRGEEATIGFFLWARICNRGLMKLDRVSAQDINPFGIWNLEFYSNFSIVHKHGRYTLHTYNIYTHNRFLIDEMLDFSNFQVNINMYFYFLILKG